jgi:hypothetical protein
MKIAAPFFIVVVAIFYLIQMGFADRLYHWVDSEGVSHISKEPPTEGSDSVDIMEYSVRKNTSEGTAHDQSSLTPERQNERTGSEKLQTIKTNSKPKNDLATACYIKAGNQDVYVYITEDRRPGGSSYQNILWKGNVARDQKKLIRSSRGKIKYSYQRASDDRSYGQNQANCVNGNVITIE